MQAPAITVNGEYIRALRDAHGYTTVTFAAVVRTSASNLSRIERGDRQPSPEVRKRIAGILRVPLVALRDKDAFEAALDATLRAIVAV